MRQSTYFRQFRMPVQEPGAFQPLGEADVSVIRDGFVQLTLDESVVEVTALAPDLFRVALFGHGRPPRYASEAVASQTWPVHDVRVAASPGDLTMFTSSMHADIQLNPLRISFGDRQGRCFAEDDPELGMGFIPLLANGEPVIDPLGSPAGVYKKHPPRERYFGCGERTGGLEKTDSHQIFWNIDPPTHHTANLNNLYTSIPFLLALEEGQAWGMFVDNPGYLEFDLARERPDGSWFGIDTGDLVYYVMGGPTPRQVVERYTQLTGRTPLPPLWALGYHQSRWGRRTSDEVLAIARQLREHDIPCDALYLDIDYMDGYRVFTWNPDEFPDPGRLVRELRSLGIRLVTIVDPGIKVDEQFPIYREGRDAKLFMQTSLGEEYRNVVWPGECAFPDFSDPRVRTWWGEKLEYLLKHGVDGIWCDMNEPTVFIPTPQTFPPDLVHTAGGVPRLHAEIHNLYGSQMAQATREGLLRHRPERRPFVISRAGYAGLQRHALHWTGDNSSWWEHLWMSMPQLQNLGLSGLAWVGVDVGGFSGDANGELLTRWVEMGAFTPFCRNHSAWNTRPQEPWSFGEQYEGPIRSMLKLRQRLIPYIYSLFDECHRTGAPVLRPLLFEFPHDETGVTVVDQFMLGPALMVAPIASASTEHRHVYLPPGSWFHLWTGERVQGPAHILVHAPLGQPAVYVRGGVPLPLYPEMLHVDDRPPDPLTLLLYPSDRDGALTLYEDAGDGYEYEGGEYLRTTFRTRFAESNLSVSAASEGRYAPNRSRQTLEIREWMTRPGSVRLDDRELHDWRYESNRLVIDVPPLQSNWTLEVLGPEMTDFARSEE